MRADASFAVPVKLWALLCVFAGVTIGGNVLLTCILTGGCCTASASTGCTCRFFRNFMF